MEIRKLEGGTPTEQLLAELCEKTFLNLWSWPRPFKSDRKELCDVIAIFENHAFVFFDRESKRLDNAGADLAVEWLRWKRNVIDRQIATALGAEKYLKGGEAIFIDPQATVPLPLPLAAASDLRVHKIIVAHGAKDAIRSASIENESGSLAIIYENGGGGNVDVPFLVHLDAKDAIHIFDSENLGLILKNLDTVYDFTAYLTEKEGAMQRHKVLSYCGEEDLLALYFRSFDERKKKYRIAVKGRSDVLHVGEGIWQELERAPAYQRKIEADRISYLWDKLLARTGANALAGRLAGDADIFSDRSAIFEMAKEPRFFRRVLARRILISIQQFPDDGQESSYIRNMTYLPSFYTDKAYIFLQVKAPMESYNDYREGRTALLKIACGMAKVHNPHLRKVIGIAIEPPKLSRSISEDFILLDCSTWSEEDSDYYRQSNQDTRFFETGNMVVKEEKVTEWPVDPQTQFRQPKIGRNEPCRCGSGKKYKKCHGRRA